MEYSFDPAWCAVDNDFWQRQRDDIAKNMFWADKIKTVSDDPAQRIAMALQNLPLPAAFKESAKALRQIIREMKKQKSEFHEPLTMLYQLAAYESLASAEPYMDDIMEPSYNVIEFLTEDDWRSLNFSYATLGFQKLPVLGKTDCKWLVHYWGEPNTHKTLRDLNQTVWITCKQRLVSSRRKHTSNTWGVEFTEKMFWETKKKVKKEINF